MVTTCEVCAFVSAMLVGFALSVVALLQLGVTVTVTGTVMKLFALIWMLPLAVPPVYAEGSIWTAMVAAVAVLPRIDVPAGCPFSLIQGTVAFALNPTAVLEPVVTVRT